MNPPYGNANAPGPLPGAGHIYYLTDSASPVLEILPAVDDPEGEADLASEAVARRPFVEAGEGREAGETLWAADIPQSPDSVPLAFRIQFEDGRSDPARPGGRYETSLRGAWLQDGQIYAYRPAPEVSPSQVIKIPYFQGSLPARPLYVYLPRGYADHPQLDYPVIYMQDGQNVFETYVADSYVGSWRAEEAADRMIGAGRMQECLIVGVSHGGEARLEEYLPPYATIRITRRRLVRTAAKSNGRRGWRSLFSRGPNKIYGRADRTFEYYQEQVAPFVRANYRARPGRDLTALCGSSMGGLFSLYAAWEHPDFARNYAALSPAFGATRERSGQVPPLERLRELPLPDIRLWLDSGTQDSPGAGDDGFPETRQARDILLEKGFVEGKDFRYLLDLEAVHNETAWGRRLPQVFEFLFPARL